MSRRGRPEDEDSFDENMEGDDMDNAFDSEASWAELDELENNLANGSAEMNSSDDGASQSQFQKRDKRREREEEIEEYEEALKLAEYQNKDFIDPHSDYTLELDEKYYKQEITKVQNGQNSIGVARMLGLKSQRILGDHKLNDQLAMLNEFLSNKKIPQWIIDKHCYLVNSPPNVLFEPEENRENEEEGQNGKNPLIPVE